MCERYEGINGTALGIRGVVKLKVSYEREKTDDVIVKVANETMRYSALLDRDVLRALGLGLTKLSDRKKTMVDGKIFSIEPSVFDGKIEKVDQCGDATRHKR